MSLLVQVCIFPLH